MTKLELTDQLITQIASTMNVSEAYVRAAIDNIINQRKKEIAKLTSQIDKSKINYNLPMGSWVSYKESEISNRERLPIDDTVKVSMDEGE